MYLGFCLLPAKPQSAWKASMWVRHFYFNFISKYFVLSKDCLSMLGSWAGCLSHQAGRERHTIARWMSFLIFYTASKMQLSVWLYQLLGQWLVHNCKLAMTCLLKNKIASQQVISGSNVSWLFTYYLLTLSLLFCIVHHGIRGRSLQNTFPILPCSWFPVKSVKGRQGKARRKKKDVQVSFPVDITIALEDNQNFCL